MELVSRIMVPQDVHILLFRTCEDMTLDGKRNFANMTKLRILRWGCYPGLSGWIQCNHKGQDK